VVLPLVTSAAAKKGSQEETVVGNPSQDALEKIICAPSTKHRKTVTHSAWFLLRHIILYLLLTM
jgi:hypothetical protein